MLLIAVQASLHHPTNPLGNLSCHLFFEFFSFDSRFRFIRIDRPSTSLRPVHHIESPRILTKSQVPGAPARFPYITQDGRLWCRLEAAGQVGGSGVCPKASGSGDEVGGIWV